jgi:riboflavin synthase alpha subunit
MVSIPKVVGVLSCGCVLVLGLSLNGGHTIKGEVVRVEPSAYFVQQYDGHQVRVHVDDTTRMTGRIGQGEHIEAKVNDAHHALAIRQAK